MPCVALPALDQSQQQLVHRCQVGLGSIIGEDIVQQAQQICALWYVCGGTLQQLEHERVQIFTAVVLAWVPFFHIRVKEIAKLQFRCLFGA